MAVQGLARPRLVLNPVRIARRPIRPAIPVLARMCVARPRFRTPPAFTRSMFFLCTTTTRRGTLTPNVPGTITVLTILYFLVYSQSNVIFVRHRRLTRQYVPLLVLHRQIRVHGDPFGDVRDRSPLSLLLATVVVTFADHHVVALAIAPAVPRRRIIALPRPVPEPARMAARAPGAPLAPATVNRIGRTGWQLGATGLQPVLTHAHSAAESRRRIRARPRPGLHRFPTSGGARRPSRPIGPTPVHGAVPHRNRGAFARLPVVGGRRIVTLSRAAEALVLGFGLEVVVALGPPRPRGPAPVHRVVEHRTRGDRLLPNRHWGVVHGWGRAPFVAFVPAAVRVHGVDAAFFGRVPGAVFRRYLQ